MFPRKLMEAGPSPQLPMSSLSPLAPPDPVRSRF